MSCCNNIPMFVYTGSKLESHGDRVKRDIKELKEKTGFDFVDLVPFMMMNQNYSVSWFPDVLKDEDGFEFNMCLETNNIFHLISPDHKVKLTTQSKFQFGLNNWYTECDVLKNKLEKDFFREKFKELGINPEW